MKTLITTILLTAYSHITNVLSQDLSGNMAVAQAKRVLTIRKSLFVFLLSNNTQTVAYVNNYEPFLRLECGGHQTKNNHLIKMEN